MRKGWLWRWLKTLTSIRADSQISGHNMPKAKDKLLLVDPPQCRHHKDAHGRKRLTHQGHTKTCKLKKKFITQINSLLINS